MKKLLSPQIITSLLLFVSVSALHSAQAASGTKPAKKPHVAAPAAPATPVAEKPSEAPTEVKPDAKTEKTAETQSTEETFWQKAQKKFTGSLRFEGYGPALTDWTAYRPNVAKAYSNDPKQQVYSKNKFSFGYKLSPSQTVGIGLQTYYLKVTGNVNKDPYLFVRDSHLVSKSNYNLDLALRVYLGLSNDAKVYHNPFGLRLVHDSTYRIDNGPLALDFYTEITWYYLDVTKVKSRQTEFFLLPNVDYSLNNTMAVNLGLKFWAYKVSGRTIFDLPSDPVLVSPSFTWRATKNFIVNHYLDIPAARLAFDMTTVGLNLNWKFL